MEEYRLYCFAQSGNAYKAALMLNLCEADWEAEFVDYFNGETRTEAFRSVNAMGEVPVLERGTVRLSQSGVILDFLADQFGRYGGRDGNERREILRWILFDNHKLTSYTATLRFLRTFSDTGETPVTDFLRTRARGAWSVLNGQLETREFVTGDRLTIADISLCGYLFWPEEIGVSWDEYPALQRWLARLQALPGWVHPYELMPGYPLADRLKQNLVHSHHIKENR